MGVEFDAVNKPTHLEVIMSKQGFSVIVAGPELAKAMPKTFKTGMSYVVASATVLGERAMSTTKAAKSSQKSGKTPKSTKTSPIKTAKAAKPTKTTAPKGSRKTTEGTDVVKFVKQNPGCNMTDIEVSTKMQQTEIRKALNAARETNSIRTEGQRRGLRYFPVGGQSTAPTQAAPVSAPTGATSEPPTAKGSDPAW